MAGIFGIEVEKIGVGLIRLFKVPLFFPIEIGLLPVAGFTRLKQFGHWFQRMVIAAAGPIASLAFAMFLFYILAGGSAIEYLVKNGFMVQRTLSALIDGEAGNFLTPADFGIVGTPLQEMLALFASLNLFLAIFNALPVPILDGGKVLFSLLEGIFGKWVLGLQAILGPISFVLLVVWSLLR